MKAKTSKINQVYLSVIIPCYNEEENLRSGVLEEVVDFLSRQKYQSEIIVSDDASTDSSLKIAEKFAKDYSGMRVLENKHGGKPWAVWKGIEAAKGKIVLFTDMDQSTPIGELKKVLPWFEKGFDVVIGSRGKVRKDAPLIRQLMALVFLTVRRIFILPNIVDTQCGFKVLRKEIAMKIFPKLEFFRQLGEEVRGWRVSAFDVELLFIAEKWGHRVKEIEVMWKDRDLARGKKKKFIKESREMVREIVRVKLNAARGEYER